MKNSFTAVFIFFFFANVIAQPGYEIQFGGANFVGATFNANYKIEFPHIPKFSITPSMGIGSMFIFGPPAIIHGALDYGYKNWNMGVEISGFVENPFVAQFPPNDFVDMIIYPNFSFLHESARSIYFKISAGLYLAYEKENDFLNGNSNLSFAGDIIPGLGLTLGYRY